MDEPPNIRHEVYAAVAYDRRFHDEQAPLSARSAEVVVPAVVALLDPRSVVDAGCGVGSWRAAFERCDVPGTHRGLAELVRRYAVNPRAVTHERVVRRLGAPREAPHEARDAPARLGGTARGRIRPGGTTNVEARSGARRIVA